jgi:hypothetical protein
MRGALRNLNTAGADRLIEGIQATVLDGSGPASACGNSCSWTAPTRGYGGYKGGVKA